MGIMIMVNDTALDSVNHIQNFLMGTIPVQLSVVASERYPLIARTLKHTRYDTLTKKEKSIVREYLQRCARYSHTQLTRLIRQCKVTHWIGKKVIKRNLFERQYTRVDIVLLAQMDEAHQFLSGGATKKLFERAYFVYKDPTYERLAHISIAHIYNLRQSTTYQCKRMYYLKTKSRTSMIGERRKPQPNSHRVTFVLTRYIKVTKMVLRASITLMPLMK